ncbi:Acetoin:2,6-dichlorophenolindophenol oxidoreductase subunit beta [Bacillus mycoides]|nr:Acetoin:2,6-dichlorophenolindophenol oxidoreductase subunit beta [Bacillus mycoides]
MTRTVSMSTAINEAMKISMRRDENVILIGEDVAGGAQVDHLQDDEAWERQWQLLQQVYVR